MFVVGVGDHVNTNKMQAVSHYLFPGYEFNIVTFGRGQIFIKRFKRLFSF